MRGVSILFEKRVKTIVLAVGLVIALIISLSSFEPKKEEADAESAQLESMLCNIEGVDEVSVVYSKSEIDNKADGVAVVYKGSNDTYVKKQIYELISALYDIPYNRIYVSH